MKNVYEGIKADEMLRKATEEYTTTTMTTDPWWGDRKNVIRHVVVEGKTYTVTTDRDGWPVLTEE